MIQQQLVDAFVQGVMSDKVARRIIEKRPDTLRAAVKVAVDQQVTNKQFDLRRGTEEPMDISRVQAGDRINNLEGAVGEMQEMLRNILLTERKAIQPAQGLQGKGYSQPSRQASQSSYGQQPRQANKSIQFKWTTDGKPICHFCSKIGHTYRRCRARQRQGASTAQQNQGN